MKKSFILFFCLSFFALSKAQLITSFATEHDKFLKDLNQYMTKGKMETDVKTMDEFLFKKSRVTLLLLVVLLGFYGWTEHRHREDIKRAAELKERLEGYERCIAPLDEAQASGRRRLRTARRKARGRLLAWYYRMP